MLGFKVYINYFLWKIGVRHVLPAPIVNRKKICENKDPLVELNPQDFLIDLSYWGDKKCFIRSSVSDMLYKAKSLLPDGMNLCILCGYRSIEQQRLEWNREFKKQKSLNPLLSDDKIEFIARKIVACPKNGFGPHQTGGAVDVTISNNHGKLDMGGDYVGENPATFSSDITIEQKENRAILYKAMTNAGFVNYPNEWWHYSFGDRAWAAYSSRKFAIYGKI